MCDKLPDILTNLRTTKLSKTLHRHLSSATIGEKIDVLLDPNPYSNTDLAAEKLISWCIEKLIDVKKNANMGQLYTRQPKQQTVKFAKIGTETKFLGS